jgi:hypothetical protein
MGARAPANEALRVFPWQTEVGRITPAPLTSADTEVLKVLSKEKPSLLEIVGLASGEKICVDLIEKKDDRESVRPLGWITIEDGAAIQPTLLILPNGSLPCG